jgi:hypothetical protein
MKVWKCDLPVLSITLPYCFLCQIQAVCGCVWCWGVERTAAPSALILHWGHFQRPIQPGIPNYHSRLELSILFIHAESPSVVDIMWRRWPVESSPQDWAPLPRIGMLATLQLPRVEGTSSAYQSLQAPWYHCSSLDSKRSRIFLSSFLPSFILFFLPLSLPFFLLLPQE